ncbi:acyltransferase, partial [bacterium]|nr:acyltransferase [bacterium]
MKKIEALQDLRGIAIIMVIFFHVGSTVFGNNNIFMHGKNDVLLFFIVSGFIISSIHKNDVG